MNLHDRFYKADYSIDEFLDILRRATDYCNDPTLSLEEGEDERGYYVVINPVLTPTFEELKLQKKADIAAARWAYEIDGIEFNGLHVTTDREDQAMITAVALSAVIDPAFTTVWKAANGYLNLDAAGVLAMARAVAAHVEAAFAEEQRVSLLIDAAQTPEELDAIVFTPPA